MNNNDHRSFVCNSPIIGQVPRKQMLKCSLGYTIFPRDIRDQHLWKEGRGSSIKQKSNCDSGSRKSNLTWQGILEQILCVWIVPYGMKMVRPLYLCFVTGCKLLWEGTRHTAWNWTANPSMRWDLVGTSLHLPQAQTGNNSNVCQLKKG